MTETVTGAELARRLGFSGAAQITRAAQAGRLVAAPDGEGYLADESIARYRMTEDPGLVGMAQRERHESDRSANGAADDAEHQPDPENAPKAPDSIRNVISLDESTRILREARAKRAKHEAEIARITHERMEGDLAETASIRDAGERLGIAFRTRLENLPDQLAPQLTAETEGERVHALLVEAIEQVLNDTARDLRQWVEKLRAGKGEA